MTETYPYSPPPSHHQSNSSVQDDKNWAMIAHGVPLAAMWLSAGTLGFVAGIVIYILSKDKGPIARNYSAQALNIQLNALIYFLISLVLCLVLIGFILLPIVAVWATILHIVGLVKSSQGVIWKPPFCIAFVH